LHIHYAADHVSTTRPIAADHLKMDLLYSFQFFSEKYRKKPARRKTAW